MVASGSSVFVHAEFWSGEQCARVRNAINRGRLSPAEIYVDGYRVDERARRTFEADVDARIVREVEDAIAGLGPGLSRFFGTPLVGSEGPGFLRYPCGGFYGAHRDCLPDSEEPFPRRISLVLFLTDAGAAPPHGCDGGSLRLYPPSRGDAAGPAFDIAPVAGSVVAFPATWLHEVLPVTAGVRDAIVDWFY
jgi:predicted 2-oxoglutarate/Fe(II)-dependent dioxygenase YbiX